MQDTPSTALTPAEQRDLRRIAGIMIPASDTYRVPGADDAAIVADIMASLGRDGPAVRAALSLLREAAGGDFSELSPAAAEATALALLARKEPAIGALGRCVLQCYYRDDRVVTALGLEPRPPFPKGHALPAGDWSLLDAVRDRPRMWRDVDGASTRGSH